MKFEKDFSKITRWVVPGWILIISFVCYMIVDIQVTKARGHGFLYESPEAFFGYFQTRIDERLLPVAVTIAGVPLGFIVYQIYYYFRWNSPFSSSGIIPMSDTGRKKDIDLFLDGIESNIQKDAEKWRKDWLTHKLTKIDFRYKLRYIEWLFTEESQVLDKGSNNVSFFKRHQYLDDVLHTLGACIVANFIGFIAYLYLKMRIQEIDYTIHLVFVVLLTFFLFLFVYREGFEEYIILNDPQTNGLPYERIIDSEEFILPAFSITLWNGKKINIDQPSILFFMLQFFTQLLINPYFNPQIISLENKLNLASRLLIVLGVILVSIHLEGKKPKSYQWGNAISILFMLIILVVLFFACKYCPSEIDWPYSVSCLLFLLFSYMLVLNRENAKRDLISIVNYVLKIKYGDKK